MAGSKTQKDVLWDEVLVIFCSCFICGCGMWAFLNMNLLPGLDKPQDELLGDSQGPPYNEVKFENCLSSP